MTSEAWVKDLKDAAKIQWSPTLCMVSNYDCSYVPLRWLQKTSWSSPSPSFQRGSGSEVGSSSSRRFLGILRPKLWDTSWSTPTRSKAFERTSQRILMQGLKVIDKIKSCTYLKTLKINCCKTFLKKQGTKFSTKAHGDGLVVGSNDLGHSDWS